MDFHAQGPKIADEPGKHTVWAALLAQDMLSLDAVADVLLGEFKSYPRLEWPDCICAVRDFCSIYLRDGEGIREHTRDLTRSTVLAVMPSDVTEAPLVEFARLLADRLRSASIIDYEATAYFPSAMKHRRLLELPGEQ